jgi:hypothetical protein
MKNIFTIIGLAVLATLSFTISTQDNLIDSFHLYQAASIIQAEGLAAPNATKPPVGALPTQTGLQDEGTVIGLVAQIINWLLGFIGIVVLGLFIFAGVQYATAAHSDRYEKAIATMTNAVVGLLILFIAYAASNAILEFVFQNANSSGALLIKFLQS